MAEKGFFAKILNGELPEAPISKLLGWKYLEFDPSSQVLKVEMQARPDFVNPVGFIHGGMLAAMLDETLSPTLALTLGPGEFAPTLEIKVNFISPAKVDRVLGTGRIVSRGRSICFLEGQLHDDQGKLLATAMATSKIGRVVGKKLKTYKLLQAISFTTANLTVNESHVSSPHHWRVNCVCVPICVGHVISNRELVLHDWPPGFPRSLRRLCAEIAKYMIVPQPGGGLFPQ